jgi:STE24 endopeptidase
MVPLNSMFTPDQIARARRYHRPAYFALGADLLLGTAVLAALAAFARWRIGPWWLGCAIVATLTLAISTGVRLPLAFWRGYVYERRWGFSTQSPGAWAADRLKGFLIAAVLTSLALVALAGTVRAFPSWWPAVAAPGAALLVLLLGFVAPVLLEPVFNRFRPMEDAVLAADLRALAVHAGVPVRDVLVADASRRTRKVNAYVSGIGATRRVVVFDTLLERSQPRELRVVVAHELGHRRARHVALGTALGMIGAAAGVVLVWALVSDPGDPASVPAIMLVGVVAQLVALPLETALSRRWERSADRFSLELTRDPEAFEAAHRELALANLSDLDPPRWLYRLLFTHPTAPERIEAARSTPGRPSLSSGP